MSDFQLAFSHLSDLVLSIKTARRSIKAMFGISSISPSLLPHVFTRAAAVYLQNSCECHHQSNQSLQWKEKVPCPLYTLMTFGCWSYGTGPFRETSSSQQRWPLIINRKYFRSVRECGPHSSFINCQFYFHLFIWDQIRSFVITRIHLKRNIQQCLILVLLYHYFL